MIFNWMMMIDSREIIDKYRVLINQIENMGQ
jgi:hypothetical protein